MWRSWNGSRGTVALARRCAVRPELEVCETRRLLSPLTLGGAVAQAGVPVHAEFATTTSPLSRYRDFIAAV